MGQGGRRQVEQPRRNHAASPPDLRDVGDVEFVLVELRLAKRRRFRIHFGLPRADVSRLEHGQPLGIRGHDPVFDPVVDHLHEMARAVAAAMEVAQFGGTAHRLPPWSAVDGATSGREPRQDGIEMLNGRGVAADHHAVAPLEPPDAATGADVDIMNALGGEFSGPPNVVDVIGIAAVDQDVAGVEERREFGNRLVNDRRRHHQPDRPRRAELADKLGQRGCADGLLGDECRHGSRRPVEHHAVVAAGDQPADHVGAHPPQSDHSQLHSMVLH